MALLPNVEHNVRLNQVETDASLGIPRTARLDTAQPHSCATVGSQQSLLRMALLRQSKDAVLFLMSDLSRREPPLRHGGRRRDSL